MLGVDRRERLEYLWEDFLSRPERVRFARTAGVVLSVALVLGLTLLLSRGRGHPQKKLRTREEAAAPTQSETVRDAFAFAKDLDGRIHTSSRYPKVYLVPSAATANQKYSKVVVMGEVASNEELRALQTEVAKSGAPVAVEWQVVVAAGH